MANLNLGTLKYVNDLLDAPLVISLPPLLAADYLHSKAFLKIIIEENTAPFDDAKAKMLEQALKRFFMIRKAFIRSNISPIDKIYHYLDKKDQRVAVWGSPNENERVVGVRISEILTSGQALDKNVYTLAADQETALKNLPFPEPQEAKSALTVAVMARNRAAILELVKTSGVNLFERYNNHKNILHIAAECNWVDVVSFLLTSPGVDLLLGQVDADGSTALHYAASLGYENIVQLLVAHKKTNVNAINASNNTPLALAVYRHRAKVVGKLIDCPSLDLSKKYDQKQNLLHVAVKNNWVDVVIQLHCNRNANFLFGEIDSNNESALHLAANNGNLKIILVLLCRSEIDINGMNINKNTALSLAELHGHAVVVDALKPYDQSNKRMKFNEDCLVESDSASGQKVGTLRFTTGSSVSNAKSKDENASCETYVP